MKENTYNKIYLATISVILGVLITIVAYELEERKPYSEAEKLQLEIQHLKYQVGIDSLRYDLELNFYERRKK